MEELHPKYARLFDGSLRDGEEPVEVVGQHWIKLMKPFLLALVVVVSGATAVILFPVHGPISNLIGTTVVTIGAAYFIYRFFAWRNEFMVVTPVRVLLQRGVFTRSTREIPLGKINDVTCSQSFLGRMLNYGNMTLDSANSAGSEVLDGICRPLEIRSVISEQSMPTVVPVRFGESSSRRQEGTMEATLVDELERLSRLYSEGYITLSEFEISKARLLQGR